MGGMNKSNLIEIFKPGKQKCMTGEVIDFTADMIRATVDAYDPAKHEAPLVIGHPKINEPAYGWVQSLSFSDSLNVAPHQVDPAFAKIVNEGKYKKKSASFFAPDSPRNPVPGVYYLRHVGFLGAVPPAVQGLKDASFAADDEEGVIEFADWDQITISNLFRKLREYIIGRDGVDTADKVLGDWEINSLQINAVEDRPKFTSFAQPTKGDEMSAEDKARLTSLEAENAALKSENATLKTQTADFAQREVTAKKTAAHVDNVEFAEALIKEGKLLPNYKASTIALMDNLADQDSAIEFGEGDGKKSKSTLEIYREQLSAMPRQVDFSERAGAEDGADIANFAAPAGMTVDAGRLELHEKALAYAAQHKCSYEEALSKVA